MILAGMIVFEMYGLLLAAIPFSIAAILRENHDRTIKDKVRDNKVMLYFVAIYYISLLLFTLYNVNYWYSISGTKFVVILFLPILLIMIFNDIQLCFRSSSKKGA